MFDERMERIFRATNVSNDSELARILGIQPPSVAGARKRKLIPISWIEKIALRYNITTDWLLFGRSPMRTDNHSDLPQSTPKLENAAQAICPRCSMLEDELRIERKEQKELVAENRQLHRDKETLLRENGELREKVARLEERKRRYEITHGLYVEDDSRV